MKKATVFCLALVLMLLLAACGKTWTCDKCGKQFQGTAYYGFNASSTLCADCANDYWYPMPYTQFFKY